MEKDALIKVILNDLKEVETLVQTFGGPKQINPAFFKLTVRKIENIKEEISLLEQLNVPENSISPEEVQPAREIPSLAKEKNEWIPEAQPIKKETESSITPVESEPELNRNEIIASETLIIEEEAVMEERLETVQEPEPVKQETAPMNETPQPDPIKEDIVSKPVTKTGSTLGETIGKDKTSVADKLSSEINTNHKVLIGKPVDDIKKAIGINDRFLYQRELFAGSGPLMDQTLNELNQLTSYSDAETFLKSNFDWDLQSETAEAFFKTVQRKFIS